jgi:hypothetical protein
VVYFLLWGNGGPSFAHEFNLWLKEEDARRTSVPGSSRIHANLTKPSLSGSNLTTLGKIKALEPWWQFVPYFHFVKKCL